MKRLSTVAALATMLAVGTADARGPQEPWTDDFDSRVQALALLESLNADLLSHASATLTLERWCGDHRMADTPKIVANRVQGADKALPEGARAELGIGADEPVRYRRVQLACGGHVLSEADNWYVPSRLTPEMNRILDTTDQPFGKVVQALGFRRQTKSADLLWSPLPKGWENGAILPPSKKTLLIIPHEVLQHRAVLYTAENQPFSLVVETYTAEVLTFPRSR
ncbi:hypothetical protein EC912_11037 [Luteibacter rhizovicinus]|uniref:Chorismate lyase n=1 Tax=Luteibacter rhizovicinus TaxID=242606 RepID=A0A4R3YH45_9GAMM|nr:hypothetical protein [Luteibacter rhizovicinus]TCV91607.1 hypothetical protein EC912_11037 [Luteibacter rhizovicinus]